MLQSHLGIVVPPSLRNNCASHITLYVHFSTCGNPYSFLYFSKYEVFALVLLFEIQFFMLIKRIFKSWLVSFIIHHFNIRSLAIEMFKRLNPTFRNLFGVQSMDNFQASHIGLVCSIFLIN